MGDTTPTVSRAEHARAEAYLDRISTIEPGAYWRTVVDVRFARSTFQASFDALLPDEAKSLAGPAGNGGGDEADGERGGADAARDPVVNVRHQGRDAVLIKAGTTLLMLDVKFVDDAMFSVVLHGHPCASGHRYELKVDDLLSRFEPDFDADAVRAREIEEANARIRRLQEELTRDQSDASILAPLVDDRLKRDARDRAKRDKRSGVAPDAGSGDGSDSAHDAAHDRASVPDVARRKPVPRDLAQVAEARLDQATVAKHVEEAKRQIVVATVRAEWLKSKTDDIVHAVSALTPYFHEKAAVALARTAGARAQAERILSGLMTLGLYTGANVEVETVREGAPASSEARMTMMQRRLFADEEMAAFVDVDAGFDYRDEGAFKEALRDPAFLTQVLPFPRSVVSMALLRENVRYDDPFVSEQANRMNRRTFLLVRDGDNVHLVRSSIPSHELASRLFATQAELDDAFRDREGDFVAFDDVRFARSSDRFKDVALHYKRLMVMLAGLDHRLGLFGRFYPATERLGFVSLDFQARYVDFVRDDEAGSMIANVHEGAAERIVRLNASVRSGSRVAVLYDQALTHKTAPAARKSMYARNGDRLVVVANPSKAFGIHVVSRDGGRLVVEVPVTKLRDGKAFNARVDLTAAESRYPGYVCLDAVTSAEAGRYVRDRQQRIRHVGWIRLFRAVEAHLKEQEAAEAPSLAVVRDAMVVGGVAPDAATASARAASAAVAWRAANRGAPLPSVDDPRLRQVMDHAWFAGQADATLARVLDHLRSRDGAAPEDDKRGPGGALRISLTGRNRAVVYASEPDAPSVSDWRWTRRTSLAIAERTVKETSVTAVWLRDAPVASETVLREWQGVFDQTNAGPQPLSWPKFRDVPSVVRGGGEDLTAEFPGPGLGVPPAAFVSYVREFERLASRPTRDRIVPDVDLTFVAGFVVAQGTLAHDARYGYLTFACGLARMLHVFGDGAQKAVVETAYSRRFRDPVGAVARLRSGERVTPTLGVSSTVPDRVAPRDYGLYRGTTFADALKSVMERVGRSLDEAEVARSRILNRECDPDGWLSRHWASL